MALAVLAIGLLAAASLQLASQRSNQLSTHATAAASLAREFGELMRANPALASLSGADGSNPYLVDSDQAASTPPAVDCLAVACTGAQMAALHVADWLARVKRQLPSGRAVTCRDTQPREADGRFHWACDGAGDAVAIKLGWTDRRDTEERGGRPLVAVALRPQLVSVGVMGAAE